MAASTCSSLMPRRAICASTMRSRSVSAIPVPFKVLFQNGTSRRAQGFAFRNQEASCPLANKTRRKHGTQIFQKRRQGCEEGGEETEEGQAEKRQGWQGRQSEEPQAGHRHRPVGSPQEGQEGSEEEKEQ